MRGLERHLEEKGTEARLDTQPEEACETLVRERDRLQPHHNLCTGVPRSLMALLSCLITFTVP